MFNFMFFYKYRQIELYNDDFAALLSDGKYNLKKPSASISGRKKILGVAFYLCQIK